MANGQVRRIRRATKRPDDVPGEFTVVAVPGTHRDNTKRHGRHDRRRALPKADRQKLLLDARRQGHSWRTAAKMAGYRSVGSAYAAAAEAIRDIPREAADEARALEMQRLDEIIRSNWPGMQAGDDRNSMVILKAIETRARLLGLNLEEPDTARIDVRLQAMIVDLISMAPEEFEQTEEEMTRLLDADQRAQDREGSATGVGASTNGVHAIR